MPYLQSKLLEIFIRRLDVFGAETVDPSLLRARVERSAGRMGTHPRVKVSPMDAGGVPAEWLVPPAAPADRALLYIHGGAWFMGSAATHRGLVSRIAYASGIRATRTSPLSSPTCAGCPRCCCTWASTRYCTTTSFVLANVPALLG